MIPFRGRGAICIARRIVESNTYHINVALSSESKATVLGDQLEQTEHFLAARLVLYARSLSIHQEFVQLPEEHETRSSFRIR